LLATSRKCGAIALSQHCSEPFALCGGTWQLRLTVDAGGDEPTAGVHAVLLEPHPRAAGPTSVNFCLRLHVVHDEPAPEVWAEHRHVGRSFGVGAG